MLKISQLKNKPERVEQAGQGDGIRNVCQLATAYIRLTLASGSAVVSVYMLMQHMQMFAIKNVYNYALG